MPIHVVNQEDVDEFYAENIGTSVLGVSIKLISVSVCTVSVSATESVTV